MTLLQRPEATTDADPPEGGFTNPAALTLGRLGELFVALLAGALCVVLGALLVTVPILGSWAAEERSTSTFWQTVGASVDFWALAHRAEVRTPGADAVFAPLLLTTAMVAICWYAARQVVFNRDELMARVPRIGGWRSAWHALGGQEAVSFVVGYLVAALLLAQVASLGVAPVWLPSLVPGAVLVPALAVCLVWWGEHRRDDHPSVDAGLRWVEAHTPPMVRRALPAAAQALLGLALASFLVVVALVLLRGDRVLELYASLDAGVVGTGVLTIAQLLAVPNAMVWALSWLSGAGFEVGTVEVGWTESTPGDLPLIPVLGALPEPGQLPGWLWGAVAVPLLAGVWIGYRAVRSSSRLSTWWAKTKIALVAALMVGVTALVLGWLATGGLTPGLLGTVGVVPWQMAGLLTLEIAAAALLTVTVLHHARVRPGRVRKSVSRAASATPTTATPTTARSARSGRSD